MQTFQYQKNVKKDPFIFSISTLRNGFVNIYSSYLFLNIYCKYIIFQFSIPPLINPPTHPLIRYLQHFQSTLLLRPPAYMVIKSRQK